MSSFSQRYGYSLIVDLEIEDFPDSLRAGLWDATTMTFFRDIYAKSIASGGPYFSSCFQEITAQIWFHFFRMSVDERSKHPDLAYNYIRDSFYSSSFHRAYDFIEFMAQLKVAGDLCRIKAGGREYAKFCNTIFARERAAVRFSELQLVQITDEEELKEISSAVEGEAPENAKIHIRRAAQLFSDRTTPDYRNSIKESISAVESIVSYIVGQKTYGVAKPLRMATEDLALHPALRDGFEKLYAFSSDAGGIRHALLDQEEVRQADARYMLTACSAFVNYLVTLKAESRAG